MAKREGLAIVLSALVAGCVRSIKLEHQQTFTAGYSRAAAKTENVLPDDDRVLPDGLPGRELFSARRGGELRTLADEETDREVVHWRQLSDAELGVNPDAFRTLLEAPQVAPDGGPWDRAYDVALSAYRDPANPLESIEPDFLEDGQDAGGAPAPGGARPPYTGAATLGAPESPMWPTGGEVCWNRGSRYSQLQQAYEYVHARPEWLATPITIAHLDTGYAAADPLLPPSLREQDSRSFFADAGTAEGGVGHGNATLSTLAGARVSLRDPPDAGPVYTGILGANPDALVREYQISHSGADRRGGITIGPVHLQPVRMAEAIITAADERVDVISMSAGGFPSVFQQQAVNYAYDHGTAIFAATGDYVSLLFFTTPRQVVYPANYDRVIGVAGVTAAGRSYGLAPCWLCLWRVTKWFDWAFRGSYGPAEAMRGHVVSGFAPNVCHSGGGGQVDLDGGGTSHATPQVAGAAAYWLAAHRADLDPGDWSSWKKTEAVYRAVLQSADKCLPEYDLETMGEGVVRARKLLDVRVDIAGLQRRPPSKIDPWWIVKQLASMLGLKRLGLQQMIHTEISQIVYRSSDVRDRLAELDLSKDGDKRSFADALVASGLASDHLEQWLKHYREGR